MRFGIFLAPFHTPRDNPTLMLQENLELIERLDRLGYDEVWVGEHHSAGHEIVASPEVFVAAAAERTRRIRLGTGVVSVPYHHPLNIADRAVLLDHLTRGRFMLGVGPGALPSDAFMLGIDPVEQRPMMEEGLEAVVALMTSDEPVSRETDWFTLRDARLQLRPYTQPHPELAVAATFSPAGPSTAGRFGAGVLTISATRPEVKEILAGHWNTASERADEYGQTIDRSQWRLVGPMHLAETREQARRDVEFGLAEWNAYFQEVAAFAIAPGAGGAAGDVADVLVDMGAAVIGTPDDAIAQIEGLLEISGGFGAFLFLAHNWADREATHRSYELFARYVMPHFQGHLEPLERSRDFAADNRERFMGRAMEAVTKAFEDRTSHATNEAGDEE